MILIAVALFGALSYAVAQMLRGGPTDIGNETGELRAGEIIEYGRKMREAVQGVRISNDCKDTEISFENSVVAGYNYATPDACKIFHPDGGAMTWVAPAPNVNDGSEWVFTGAVNVKEVGDDATDELIVLLPGLTETACLAINDSLGLGLTSIPIDSGDYDEVKFTGGYANGDTISGGIGAATCPAHVLCGKPVGCFQEETDGQRYIFYQSLIVR
ncbi:MAG: hypothetical protein DHS20C02_15910 [Micavibrio sp.]|nr:MAG: hypothetical protein DHS20C02_15910 [Micavibrio sp.]